MSSLTDIRMTTNIFGSIYRSAKGKDGWEKLLKETQQEFFDAVTAHLETTILAQKTVLQPEYYPGWRILDDRDWHNEERGILIEEDPAIKPYAYVNTDDGYVYKRGVTRKEDTLDVERLREEDEDLYHEMTYVDLSMKSLLQSAMLFAHVDDIEDPPDTSEEDIQWAIDQAEAFTNWFDVERTFKEPKDWTPKQAAKLQKYLVPGTVSPRLVPPRKATEEELETGEVEDE